MFVRKLWDSVKRCTFDRGPFFKRENKMRKIIFQIVIFAGALSNAMMLAMSNTSIYIVVGSTVVYIIAFQLLLRYMEPRFIRAERLKNKTKYPFLLELQAAKKATVILQDGSIYYNAQFDDYVDKSSTKIRLQVSSVKTKKQEAQGAIHEIDLTSIKSVKKIQ